MISGRQAFLLPVAIDATRDAEADVLAEFCAVQWTRLPGGEQAEKFGARVKALLDDAEVGRISDPALPTKINWRFRRESRTVNGLKGIAGRRVSFSFS